jgi:hypothetical protein
MHLWVIVLTGKALSGRSVKIVRACGEFETLDVTPTRPSSQLHSKELLFAVCSWEIHCGERIS